MKNALITGITGQDGSYPVSYTHLVILMDTAKIQYIIPSIGITAARIFHMNAAWTIYAGRLLNMCFFIIMVALAIRIIPIGKEAILFITLNPVMLQSLISYSYDVFVYAILILYMSLCLRYALCENVILTIHEELALYLLGLLEMCIRDRYYTVFSLYRLIPYYRRLMFCLETYKVFGILY